MRGGLVLGLAHRLLHSLEFVREKSAPRGSGYGGGNSGGATQGNCEGGGEVAVGKFVGGEEMDADGGGGDMEGQGAGAVGGGAGVRGSDWVGGELAIDGRGLRVLMAALSCASALATLSPHLHLRSSSAPELRRSAASAGREVGGEGGGGTGRESSGGGQAGVVQAVAGGGGVEAVVGGRGSSGGRQEDVVGARVGDGRGPAVLLMWAWSVLLTQGCLGGAILRERTLRRLVEINHGRAGDYLPTHVASRLFALAVPACKALISLIMDAKAREVQMQLVEAAVARVHEHVALLAGEAREAANLLETHQLSFHLWTTEAATKLRVTSGVAAATVLKALLPLLSRLCPPPHHHHHHHRHLRRRRPCQKFVGAAGVDDGRRATPRVPGCAHQTGLPRLFAPRRQQSRGVCVCMSEREGERVCVSVCKSLCVCVCVCTGRTLGIKLRTHADPHSLDAGVVGPNGRHGCGRLALAPPCS